MTELICWPLDNKQYTSVALGAAYAARSRGVLNADSILPPKPTATIRSL